MPTMAKVAKQEVLRLLRRYVASQEGAEFTSRDAREALPTLLWSSIRCQLRALVIKRELHTQPSALGKTLVYCETDDHAWMAKHGNDGPSRIAPQPWRLAESAFYRMARLNPRDAMRPAMREFIRLYGYDPRRG
jgi:hypothetical protein